MISNQLLCAAPWLPARFFGLSLHRSHRQATTLCTSGPRTRCWPSYALLYSRWARDAFIRPNGEGRQGPSAPAFSFVYVLLLYLLYVVLLPTGIMRRKGVEQGQQVVGRVDSIAGRSRCRRELDFVHTFYFILFYFLGFLPSFWIKWPRTAHNMYRIGVRMHQVPYSRQDDSSRQYTPWNEFPSRFFLDSSPKTRQGGGRNES